MISENKTYTTTLNSPLYFCSGCNAGWKDNKWMTCCKGCVGHKKAGWSLRQMRQCYSVSMDALYSISGKYDYWFPMIDRPPTLRRLGFDLQRTVVNENILQPFSKYELDWRLQQGEILQYFMKYPTRNTWDALDPEVQHRVLYKEKLRY
jgi:hypothetical protein